jgi:hypothetical protein
VDEDDFIECLCSMPTVVHLEFYRHPSSHMGEKTFTQLTFPSSTLHSEQANYLVPKLEVLRICIPYGIMGPAAFVDMIESRRRLSNANVSLLQTLRLQITNVPSGLTLSQISRLCDCVMGGLDIQKIKCGGGGETVIPWDDC